MGITAIGLPFYVLSTGGTHLIRADRSPTYSMTCILAGAAINTILDPLFIFGFGWGIKGAAWATVIGADCIRTSDHLLFFQTPKNVPGPLHADS